MTTQNTHHSFSQLPGPKGLPLLGNLLQIDLQKLHSILEGWADHYGDIYQFKLFNKTVVAISEPTLIQSIMRDHPETYRRVSAIERVGAELGSNDVFCRRRGTMAAPTLGDHASLQTGAITPVFSSDAPYYGTVA